jgi:hypothetical protein
VSLGREYQRATFAASAVLKKTIQIERDGKISHESRIESLAGSFGGGGIAAFHATVRMVQK